MKMEGAVAIVTGAGHPRGIGRAIALALARDGADVVLVDIDVDGAAAIAEEVRALGRRALAVQADVSNEDQVNAMVQATVAEFGRVDVLVNNAGVNRHHPVLEITSEEWDWLLAVNLKGAFLCTKAVLPTMVRQGRGRVVSISSILASWGADMSNGAHYAASKAGVIGFAKSVARQMASHGITSNVVAPGPIDTDITREFEPRQQYAARRRAQASVVPVGRVGTPQDVADAVVFLASESASFITGEVLAVNGGLHID